MSENNSNHEIEAPSATNLLTATIATIIGALILLVLVVLPAEYGIDPTGFGELTGLDALSSEAYETIEIIDIIGGNEVMREVEIPMFGEPTPYQTLLFFRTKRKKLAQ